ncbi:MAG TPA: amidohydrolase family protein [Gemmatimonadaceae bacterium]|nr:amidohydrolase family protein [Gemmatimonadaceae bacterium]
MSFILIENGELYCPEPKGRKCILLANKRIEKIAAKIDRRALDTLGVEYDVIDARGCVVTPGLVDAHEHLLGGSGEGSLALQTPMLFPSEILRSGITTVVGTLGVDTTIKTIQGLLGRAKALTEEGITARMWTGGYNIPPTTLMNCVRDDMVFVDEVVGCGEIAISDERGLNQSAQELAKIVRDTHVGGLLSGKAGISHFHVGEEKTRLKPLRDIIEQFQVKPDCLYPTHVQRNEKLLREAIELAHAGAYVDFDTVNEDLAKWFKLYIDEGGPMEKLTISSDADSGTPDIHYRQLCELVVKHRYTLDLVLPMATTTPARLLKLEQKGCIEEGKDADVLVLDEGTLEIRDVISQGERRVADGRIVNREKFLKKSKRHFTLLGDEAPPGLGTLDESRFVGVER